MKRVKAFLLGFFLTFAAILPMCLAAGAVIFSRAAPADVSRSGIPVRAPMPGDTRCILIMTGPHFPQNFTLVRFDAPDSRISCTVLPAETVMLAGGSPVTLLQAAESAGPAQAAACIGETLGIRPDHYLYCPAPQLAALCEVLGTAHLPLSRYLEPEVLQSRGLDLPGIRTLGLTPEILAFAVSHAAKGCDLLLRADGYLAFLRAGQEMLPQLPDALRPHMGKLSTDLTAADLLDYERIFGFLSRSQPEYRACVLPVKRSAGRCELTEHSLQAAADCLGLPAKSSTPAEDACGTPSGTMPGKGPS